MNSIPYDTDTMAGRESAPAGSYELIAFDMDGTLLDSGKQVLPDSLEMISRAVKAGKSVALSTGRSLPELALHLELLKDVRYLICVSGALVYDRREQKVIYAGTLTPEMVFQIMDLSADQDLMLHMTCEESMVDSVQLYQMARYNMAVYQEPFLITASPKKDLRGYYRAHPVPLYKCNLYTQGEAQRQLMRSRLAGSGLMLVDSEISSLECSAPGVSKGRGLIELCKYLNIPVEKSIAVGDADNDLEILKTAGLAVAMGNSNERVKAIADVIVADNDHGGCAQAIRDYLLAK